MRQSILDDGITGKIQNELWRLGYKCSVQRLAWFTDKPIHDKSRNIQGEYKHNLDEPYMTTLGYKTACKLYEELKQRTA